MLPCTQLSSIPDSLPSPPLTIIAASCSACQALYTTCCFELVRIQPSQYMQHDQSISSLAHVPSDIKYRCLTRSFSCCIFDFFFSILLAHPLHVGWCSLLLSCHSTSGLPASSLRVFFFRLSGVSSVVKILEPQLHCCRFFFLSLTCLTFRARYTSPELPSNPRLSSLILQTVNPLQGRQPIHLTLSRKHPFITATEDNLAFSPSLVRPSNRAHSSSFFFSFPFPYIHFPTQIGPTLTIHHVPIDFTDRFLPAKVP
jgi:hypothetical protein